MGMFDYVKGTCLECGEEFIDQSKGGPCKLDTYHFDKVSEIPLGIIVELQDWGVECDKCKHVMGIDVQFTAKLIKDK